MMQTSPESPDILNNFFLFDDTDIFCFQQYGDKTYQDCQNANLGHQYSNIKRVYDWCSTTPFFFPIILFTVICIMYMSSIPAWASDGTDITLSPVMEAELPLINEPFELPPEWSIAPGLLREQLEGWSARADYQLIWQSPHDFEMVSKAVFHNDFIGAVQQLINMMHSHGNLLRVTIYQGNKVIEVTEE